ncbi:MAG: hypothetical protein R2741_14080 [Methanolobus sp.]
MSFFSYLPFTAYQELIKKEAIKCPENEVDILAPDCGLAPESLLKNLLAMLEERNEYVSGYSK